MTMFFMIIEIGLVLFGLTLIGVNTAILMCSVVIISAVMFGLCPVFVDKC